MKIQLKLYSVLKFAAGLDMISLDIPPTKPTVRSAIATLASRPDCLELSRLILGDGSSDPRSNTLILVSGREIGALAGLDTVLKEGDELSLLPVAHGG